MYRKRVPKRRGLTLMEPHNGISSGEAVNQNSSEIQDRLRENSTNVAEITSCKYHPHICGKEAACRNFENNTSKCVCPHDASPPTLDLRCPNRSIVPLTPRPIHNIIPPNGNVTNSTTLPEAEQVERLRQKVPEIIGLTIAFIAVLGILFGILYCYRKKCYNVKSQRNTLDATPLNLEKSILLANKYTLNSQYFTCTPEVPILRRDCLVFLHDIGEGCFGKVYKGELRQGENIEVVAVKVLKESASREAEEDFMREVDIMSTFKHENILSLKGVVLRDSGNSPWMVFEYMPYGDLAEVLRSNSKQFNTSIPGLQPFTKDSLHWITIQIAAGMNYLAAQRFVHRDLACRNCLVGSGLVVKIADFGMSRDVYTCDYYKIGGSRLLPVRWMSPESITFGRFTLESDVWSFGVVLWEVYSFGKQPYYGHNNEEVVKLILQGIMLIPPDECPPYICKIMQDCWKTEPRDRVNFVDILERLEKIQEKSSPSSPSSPSESSPPTSCLNAMNGSLPRPPQGPVAIRSPDLLDPDGYLLPAPMIPPDYLQALPPLN